MDRTRIGMTGRSGGGSYTWTTAALDERIKAAAPVAGITDLRNHVCDGAVEGHCDCMFFVNTHRWDFAMNAALIAPRPLLIVNTDADNIFPLDGVNRLFAQTRRIYGLLGAYEKIGLVIGPGGHTDSQNLQVPVLRWFNQHLRGADPLVTDAATKPFAPTQLRVFDQLPSDQRNTTAQQFFGERPAETMGSLDALRKTLREQVFMGWPAEGVATRLVERAATTDAGLRLSHLAFESQTHVPLRLFTLQRENTPVRRVELRVVDESGWVEWLGSLRPRFGAALGEFSGNGGAASTKTESSPADGTVVVTFSLRGVGPSAWAGDARKQIQIRRRFQLLGQTVDGMRVWDVHRATAAVRERFPGAEVVVSASGTMAAHALHAAAFEEGPLKLELRNLPASYRDGVDYLNAGRVAELPKVLEWVRTRHSVVTAP